MGWFRTVTTNGRQSIIALPRELTQAMKWRRGDVVALTVQAGALVIRTADPDKIASTPGMIPPPESIVRRR
jgi:bifunctional DNA-binding transcriptional regulator/antitoxin component of YhaV-PrlF toxin-antitoxin module